MRAASSASAGFSRSWSPRRTVVSAAMIQSDGNFSAIAAAFSRDNRATYSSGDSPSPRTSGMWLGMISKSRLIDMSSSRRRGEAEARTNLMVRPDCVSSRASEASRGTPYVLAMGSLQSLRSVGMTHELGDRENQNVTSFGHDAIHDAQVPYSPAPDPLQRLEQRRA